MIQSLSYIGFASPHRDDWRTFAPDVLGAEVADDGPAGEVRIRVDDRVARIHIHRSDREQLAYLGWDVVDAAGLDRAAARVDAASIALHRDPALAAIRSVDDLAWFVDPLGFRHELTHGLAAGAPFVPARPMSGFVTGQGGLGHVVLLVPDLLAAERFLVDVLGFTLSDTIEQGVTLRFFHCNPRHHTIAIAAVPGMVGMHHLMLEVGSIDDVGTALDVVNERRIPLAMGLGRHTNDLMTSFYVRTPSGFEIEYGTGGRLIDDSTWQPDRYASGSLWGHKTPDRPLRPEILAAFTPAAAS